MYLGCAAIRFAAAVDDPASIPCWDQLDVEGDTDTPRRNTVKLPSTTDWDGQSVSEAALSLTVVRTELTSGGTGIAT
ncbi:MAG: hypothetical protein ACR2NF_12780 [Pirellulales bacterium]